MEIKTALKLCSAVAAILGLVLGGIIGHFATKHSHTNLTDVRTAHKLFSILDPDPAKDKENRKFLLDLTSASEIKDNLRFLSSKPHLAGSVENNKVADWLENKWKEFGFKTRRDVYNVLLSYPGGKTNRNKAEILAGDGTVTYTCQTEEKVLDPIQNEVKVVPPFNAYAKAGRVESDLVYYVNYCRDTDFKYITEDAGISLNNSIVICRYGLIFRGNKVKLAEDHGALGVIIYNDPKDYVPPQANATYAGTFPNSAFLPPSGAQRGSVLTGQTGDPMTPNFPAKDYSTRKSLERARSEGLLRKVPTQPMGYGDAEHFLKLLEEASGSKDTTTEWKGRIDGVTYKLGGQLKDGKKIRIVNNNREEYKDITNVFGIIEGAVEPDRYVLVGNHFDAWMFGATDALSGTVAMVETARVFSELTKTGWRPRRTIIFCNWDAEEYGIIGSVEWLEDVRALLQQRAVAYINVDCAVTYPQQFLVGSSPLLYNAIYQAAKMVPQPNKTDATLYDGWKISQQTLSSARPAIVDLGAGTDHTGFYHMLGISSAHVSYIIDKRKTQISDWYSLYHTTYETFKYVESFVDPTFSYHQAVSRFMTELTRSLSDSVTIPFTTKDYATRLSRAYVQLNDTTRSALAKENLTSSLDYLERAINKFSVITEVFDDKVRNANYTSWAEVRRLNDQLMLLERAFLFPLGILDRTYLKHVVFAPSATNSYSGTAFPGIGDALATADRDGEVGWEMVKTELTKAIYVVESACKVLQDADGTSFW